MTTAQAAELFTATGPHFGLLTAQQRVTAWRAVLERAASAKARETALHRIAFWQEVADTIAAHHVPRVPA